tara:strand:- start:250 stop:723 length:474 start_codon:yes stop_codon:yes gene_type:complete
MLSNNQIKDLDEVLNYINSLTKPYRENFDEIHDSLNKTYKISTKDLTIAIHKLVVDGSIRSELPYENGIPNYFMTYDGLNIGSNGGYEKHLKELEVSRKRKEDKEIADLDLAQKRLKDYPWTRFVAWSGFVMSIVGVLWKYRCHILEAILRTFQAQT